MIKRSTWIMLVILLALAGFLYYLNNKPESATPEVEDLPMDTVTPVEFLFPAEEGVVTSIFIESREGSSLWLEREGGTWVMTLPVNAAADPGYVEAAASQLTAIPIISRLELDPGAVGLDIPAFTFRVGFSSGKFFVVQIGDETPTGTGYYVRKEDGSVVVVSKDSIDMLTSMLEFLPYLETPTPSLTPVPTETTTPTQTPDPTGTATTTPATVTEMPTVTKTP